MPDGGILIEPKPDKEGGDAAALKQLLSLLKALMLLAPLGFIAWGFFTLKQDILDGRREAAEAKSDAAEAKAEAAASAALALTVRNDALGADTRSMTAINALERKMTEGVTLMTGKLTRLEVQMEGVRGDIAEQKANKAGK